MAITPPQINWTGSSFFWSGLSTAGNCCGLNVDGAKPVAGTPIILWPWQGGQPNELWTIDEYGHIISVLLPSLVIGLGASLGPDNGNYTQLVEISITDASQMWAFEPSGLIANKANLNLYLNVYGGVANAGSQIITYKFQQGGLDEVWWAAPVAPPNPGPSYFFLQSALTDEVNTYGVAIDVSGLKTPAVLASWSTSDTSQLWSPTPDGHWLSALRSDGNLALGLALPASLDSHYVSAVPFLQDATGEQWSLSNGMIVNAKDQTVLTVKGGSGVPGAPIISAPAVPGGSASQGWSVMPTSPLAGILAQAPLPFRTFTGDQGNAYSYINTQLKLGGEIPLLRAQYTNTTATLDTWYSNIQHMQCPSDISPDDWTVVTTQLMNEITCVIGVQALFSSYLQFHTALFAGQLGLVTQFGGDLGLDTDTQTQGSGLAILGSMVYAGLSSDPDGIGSAVANLLEVVIAIAQAQGSSTPIGSGFQVAYSALVGELTDNFNAAYAAASNAAYSILSDWGRVSATYPLTLSTGVGGLSWQVDANDAAQAFVPAFSQSLLQILFPAQYQLWYQYNSSSQPVGGVPSWAQAQFSVGQGMWYDTWLAEISDSNSCPSQQAMNDVFGTQMDGIVDVSDFWYGEGGWGFTVQSADEGGDVGGGPTRQPPERPKRPRPPRGVR